MRDVEDIARARMWADERPGSIAWLWAGYLNAHGSPVPWTARAVLGRSLKKPHG